MSYIPSSEWHIVSVRIGKLQSCSFKESPLLVNGESKASRNIYKPNKTEIARQRYISSEKLAWVIDQHLEREKERWCQKILWLLRWVFEVIYKHRSWRYEKDILIIKLRLCVPGCYVWGEVYVVSSAAATCLNSYSKQIHAFNSIIKLYAKTTSMHGLSYVSEIRSNIKNNFNWYN